MDNMDNGKGISKRILNNNLGVTMVELMITVGLTGVLAVGVMFIIKSNTSLTAESARKYAQITSLMLPIKKLKRDISIATEVEIKGSGRVEIVSGIILQDKYVKIKVVYENAECESGVWGSSASKEDNPKELFGKKKKIPCMTRTKTLKDGKSTPAVTRFLGIKAVRWCKGGERFMGDCDAMSTEFPEMADVKRIKSTDLSNRRFMAEFMDRTNRVIALTVDLGAIYDETLIDKVQIAR